MREYNYDPRPTVEDHHHIRELIESQEKRVADRTYHQNRAKALEERMSDIKAAPGKDTKMFYCEPCGKDFIAESVKEVEKDWSNPNQYIAFYRSKCFNGHWCMRHITDTHQDRYFAKSKVVAQNRGIHSIDILQPFQTGYQLAFGKK